QARIDPLDRGLTLGEGLFETIAVRRGAPLRLGAHMSRLEFGASVLQIPLPLTEREIQDALLRTLQANGLSEGVLRLTLTRGAAARGLLPQENPAPTLMITASGRGPVAGPVRALISKLTRRNEYSPLSRCKATARPDDIIARMEADSRGAGDALLLNTAGRLAESTAANLFLVFGDKLVTPPVGEGALPGVMRAHVIEVYGAEESSLAPVDLGQASEAFLTNSLGVRALVEVDGQAIGSGKQGPVTLEVLAADDG
ncbi:MAG TPA: 2-keto-4-methylthiobutyrate aminotransferase, partial [Rhodospirillales bacterium]|nr:2-keto-4-methylthiobutyrate aminotransferase [Rhodospirillales bacterium]